MYLMEDVFECRVIVVGVRRRDFVGEERRRVQELHVGLDCGLVEVVGPWAHNLWRGELVGGVHTLVGGVVQVYHVLLELEEEDKGREEVQEIERERSGARRDAHEDDHGWRWKDSNNLSHGACASDERQHYEQTRLCAQTRRAQALWVSGSGCWCTHCAVPRNQRKMMSLTSASCSVTQAWMLSLAFALCFVTKPWMLSLAFALCFVTKS